MSGRVLARGRGVSRLQSKVTVSVLRYEPICSTKAGIVLLVTTVATAAGWSTDMRHRIVAIFVLTAAFAGFDAFAVNRKIVAQEVDPAELVKDIHAIFGEHHARAVHAKGVEIGRA